MAIKGKKKSQARGSQARRRPAAAPRPAYSARSRQPWYRTPGGQVTIGVVLALLFGLGSWAFLDARSDAREQDRQQEDLDEYTTNVRGVAEALGSTVAEMTAMPAEPSEPVVERLAEAPEGWVEQLGQVETTALGIETPQSVLNVHPVFTRAISLYASAAQTYALVPDAEGGLQRRLLARAADIRDQATGVFLAAVSLLDGARLELDMGSSRIEPPGAPSAPTTPDAIPSALNTVPVEVEGGNEAEGDAGGGQGGRRRNNGTGAGGND